MTKRRRLTSAAQICYALPSNQNFVTLVFYTLCSKKQSHFFVLIFAKY